MKQKLQLEKKKILVVGDVMLDCYYTGDVDRISPEAPVPVFLKNETKYVLGGAANVAANLIAAAQSVHLGTFIGNDKNAGVFIDLVSSMGINTGCILKSDNRMTTVKTRLLAQNNQQLLRIDEEKTNPVLQSEEDTLINKIKRFICDVDIIILSDYLKGILSFNMCQRLIKIAKEKNIPVFIDIKDKHIEKYKGATLLKPNKNELTTASGISIKTMDDVYRAARVLLNQCECDYVLVTLGSRGMVLVDKNDEHVIPCIKREVYDVSGAGDTVISYLAAAYANGYSMDEAAYIANFAAGIKVTKIGTSPVYLEELMNKMQYCHPSGKRESKLLSIEELLYILHHRGNRKIVFTNGCFDLIHKGHVSYLERASEIGDILIVGLNSDLSVKRLKGNNRPINSQEDRAKVLSALESVDYIVIFEEDTPIDLIKEIRPDILVKGSDYKKEEVIGAEFVEGYGGKVELIPFLSGYSTTGLIKK